MANSVFARQPISNKILEMSKVKTNSVTFGSGVLLHQVNVFHYQIPKSDSLFSEIIKLIYNDIVSIDECMNRCVWSTVF